MIWSAMANHVIQTTIQGGVMGKINQISKAVWVCVIATLMVGCAGTLALHPRDGGEKAVGAFNTGGRSMEVTVGQKRYGGSYITNAGTSYSTAQAFSGNASAFGNAQTFHGGNSGVALLTAADGDTMRCEFKYQGMQAIGVCQTRAGRVFDMTTQ
jgi:hypothetical protein